MAQHLVDGSSDQRIACCYLDGIDTKLLNILNQLRTGGMMFLFSSAS
jgi:hypothetical protein